MVYPGYTFGGKPQQITSSFAVNRQGHVTVTGKVCQGLSKVVNQRMGAFPVATNQKVGSSNLSGRATLLSIFQSLRPRFLPKLLRPLWVHWVQQRRFEREP